MKLHYNNGVCRPCNNLSRNEIVNTVKTVEVYALLNIVYKMYSRILAEMVV
jgi:hypothetical protein